MITPTSTQIYNSILARLRDEAGITAEGPSSVASALAAGFADVSAALWSQIADIDRGLSLDRAIGPELDKLGEFLGVSRRIAERASTLGYGPAVILRNNGATVITVAAGTAIFPSSEPLILFRTTVAATIPGYGTAAVDVQANNTGPQYNVSAQALNAHNSGIPQLSVSNPRPIDSGSETESDDSYRGRLYQSIHLKNPGSRQAIRLALAALPGVRDVILVENSGGAGTFDALLIGQGSLVPTDSIALAESYLQEFAPIGVAYRVLTPTLIPIDITIRLILPPGQETNRTALTTSAAQAARQYIESLSIELGHGEGEFVFSEMIERVGASVLEARDYSIDVFANNTPLVFGTNYIPQQNERLSARRVRVE